MNLDNQRLIEIQQLKNGYGNELEKADTIEESLLIQSRIDELEREEIDILERCNVEI